MNTDSKIELLRVHSGGVASAAVWPSIKCACGRMAAFVVNRNGVTRCLDCDAKVKT